MPDPTKFRINIGVRTLDQPVGLGFDVYRSDRTQRGSSVFADYPANDFVQTGAEQLLGTTLQPGDAIVVRAAGILAPAFVYASTTDNTSQDPSIQYASVLR